MNEPSITDLVQLAERGELAKLLLESDTFIRVMNDLGEFHLAAMVACKPIPSELETRDYHHTMLHALREITDTVGEYVGLGTEAQSRLDAILEPQEDFE